jgi:hypothetical protein
MKYSILSYLLLFSSTWFLLPVRAQDSPFDVDAYKQFLQQHQNMNADELLSLHPAGTFRGSAIQPDPAALYLDSIEIKYQLTGAEKDLLRKFGFVVTERLNGESFGERFMDIYHKDLPVYISADAVLHAFHCSYDKILKDIEISCLIPRIKDLLQTIHEELPGLVDRYSSNAGMQAMLHDVDLYLTVPRKMLDPTAQPYFPATVPQVASVLQNIGELQPAYSALFTSTPKRIDFSQFKVRGHYDDPPNPKLADYFKAMIWLGRIEIYLLPPRSLDQKQTRQDMERQVVDAYLLAELIDRAGAYPMYRQIESILSFFIGDQDNVTLDNLYELNRELNITAASDLLDTLRLAEFQQALAMKPYAGQKILSQILMNLPCSPDSIVPASSFMLYGQRFVIDSYVTGNVVYDRIRYQGMAVTRMLPSTLDILFSLGNDAAGQLLQPELERYHYASNLSALRYLIDSYPAEFWNSSLHNMWLHTVRALNPPLQRGNLPLFMQTAAWWQKNMNSQLASWTELRHDHLLYAKQSYTGGVICSFPYGYVEPVPELFSRLEFLGLSMAEKIGQFDFDDAYMTPILSHYFLYLGEVCHTLASIAQKELRAESLSENDKQFLRQMIGITGGCGPEPNAPGWYQQLFYSSLGELEGFLKKDFLTADYHTSPTDEAGFMVGWVAHAGTGPVDMLILTAQLPGTGPVAFIGPVPGYYEYTTLDFLRLSDDEWKEIYQVQAVRPDWTNLYLCDNQGNLKEAGSTLLTDIPQEPDNPSQLPVSHIMTRCYPNPFNAGTLIQFTLPQYTGTSAVQVDIYDIQGRRVRRLLDAPLNKGDYFIRWDGTDNRGRAAASGIYFYEIGTQGERIVGKLQLIR